MDHQYLSLLTVEEDENIAELSPYDIHYYIVLHRYYIANLYKLCLNLLVPRPQIVY